MKAKINVSFVEWQRAQESIIGMNIIKNEYRGQKMEEETKLFVLILSLIGDLRKVVKPSYVYNLTINYCLHSVHLIIKLSTL